MLNTKAEGTLHPVYLFLLYYFYIFIIIYVLQIGGVHLGFF